MSIISFEIGVYEFVFDAGDPSQLGSLYASRIPKLEPTETHRSQWMASNARPSALVHRKLYLFYFYQNSTLFIFANSK